ncbi:uncharacterized protein N7477_007630 [Penicillium maclennaniae]|uniref:uncharacterized protein n=1 Tax=Penicillium maclennaniae TaxID=1343394 RepID=UPI0025401E75|nr:uncharacterized protein N7477_007630 [Penicillium maclennaniae]KAJ5665182.1 hypothetical protein N7477_007630 [Penicillium maclennaniae]
MLTTEPMAAEGQPRQIVMGNLLIEPAGKTVSPAYAKATSAAFAGLKVDKLAEIKGVDEFDKIEAKIPR